MLGPSGAGKSTLIKVLLGIRNPDEGEIQLGNESISSLGPIGYVPQDDALHRDLRMSGGTPFLSIPFDGNSMREHLRIFLKNQANPFPKATVTPHR